MNTALRLALMGLAGMVLAAATLEGAARLGWPEAVADSCAIPGGYGGEFKPGCTSAPMRLPESPWITDTTNECGWRTAESCRNRPAGGLRVAVLGTSVARGHFVAYADTFAARATADLSRSCRRPVEFQNLAIPRTTSDGKPVWHHMADRAGTAAALGAEAIVVVLSPTDLGFYTRDLAAPDLPVPQPVARPGVIDRIKGLKQVLINNSRALAVMRAAIYRDPGRFVPLFLRRRDDADFVRAPQSAAWEMRLRLADGVLARVAAAARTAGVPWFVVLVPTYGQSALAAAAPAKGIDPLLLGKRLDALVTAQGGTFVDVTPAMARVANLGDHYYVADGHPDADGHAVIAASVTAMLRRDVPAFAGCGG